MGDEGRSAGPLTGLRVLELAGIGPVPHAAMILADLGADVVRVDRPGGLDAGDQVLRGRRAAELDLRSPAGRDTLLELADRADVLLEGFRPGVTERLGIGPDVCLARNPRLVYGRMTGWGRTGPRAHQAGHDINYLALAGVLHGIGRPGERPVPPMNLVGDFGGGSMFLVTGVLAALVERGVSGRGQVVDAAMVDGASLLMQMMWSWRAQGGWTDTPGSNLLDGGAPFYDTYRCADGRHVAVGALEPAFYAQLLDGLGITPDELPDRADRGSWPILRERFTAAFARHDLAHWRDVFDGSDACVTPVLSMTEALDDPHLRAHGTHLEIHGVPQPGPAPRFSRTPPGNPAPPASSGIGAAAVLRDWPAPGA
ncbi:CaiB/BaiF CoA-transferase family protein [Kineosporia mesophila]|uniref:CaiB/BaiF CoA-transferase family protein n=1 Tax=Kineosporia mesophila TaxID=566012 RepID=A0ABP7AJB1_9ACTN|nr:CaiB/BaiF CoA-transferase family protein [Kineosporia mesophila]MCD5352430.1 CoA transferase [Kineosporia mesophila]